uniref:Heme lyase n=1 Tax=Reclinomonas americana TaxID=48483 RepID=O21277_RECAM|nr:heme lyase [Reclinomonas americana]AAD11904.1 heme lyase [Reclinomonas americana]
MSSFFGHFLIIIAIFLLIIIFFKSFFYNKQNKIIYKNQIQILISIYFFILTLSFFSLLESHLFSNISIINILNSTHSKQPLIYKICALWSNHEGSMLLWCWILSIYTYSLLFLRKLTIDFFRSTILIQSLINLFFLFFILFTSNPFLQIIDRFLDGKQLNPILQDIVLSIHPPLVYLGYLGFSIPFSLTIAYLFNHSKETQAWLFYIQKYNLISWCFLTFGIFLGSWWAYYELGWGGWWFWDPVENASLMPWILSTALLHSILNTKKSNTLTKTTIYLSFFCFYSSLLGTFFVRSGLIDSVHSFASDSNRGQFIFCFLFFLFLIFIYLILKYNKYIFSKDIRNLFSKEGLISLNQFFFISFYIIILIGTFYPTIHYFFFKQSITIGPSFYNQMIIPILVPFFIFMISSLYFHWESIKIKKIFFSTKELLFIFCFSTAIFSFLFFENYQRFYILYLFIPFLVWSILKHFYSFFIFKKYNSFSMLISHFGVTIFILSVLLWYCFYKESHQIMYPGDRHFFNHYEYIFKGINLIKGPNYDAFYGSFLILKNNTINGTLFPEKRHYYIQDFYASKVDIHSNFFDDVHAIIGDGNLYTGWSTSFYVYPFLSWIWFAGFLLVLGGLVSIFKKKQRIHILQQSL